MLTVKIQDKNTGEVPIADNKISADDDYGNNPDMSTDVEEIQKAAR